MVSSPAPVHRRRYSDEFKPEADSTKQISELDRFQADLQRLKRHYGSIKNYFNSGNGKLYTAIERATGETIILKEIPKRSSARYELDGKLCCREIYYHYKAAKVSKRVVRPLNWFERKHSFVLAMEKPEGYSDVHEICRAYAPIDHASCYKITVQIARAVAELRDGGMYHLDIKPDNIMMHMKTLEVKLIDFGCAASLEEIALSDDNAGTDIYMPPEWTEDDAFIAEPAAVWSVGACFYILSVGEWCIDEDNYLQRCSDAEEHLPKDAVDIIDQALNADPFDRVKLDDLIVHLNALL